MAGRHLRRQRTPETRASDQLGIVECDQGIGQDDTELEPDFEKKTERLTAEAPATASGFGDGGGRHSQGRHRCRSKTSSGARRRRTWWAGERRTRFAAAVVGSRGCAEQRADGASHLDSHQPPRRSSGSSHSANRIWRSCWGATSERGVPATLIGRGTNLVVRDGTCN